MENWKTDRKKSNEWPIFLSVIDKPVSSIWYKKTLMGKNTIAIMKKMKENVTHHLKTFTLKRLPTIVLGRL